MAHPIRNFSRDYMLRPGWSEFGAYRAGGSHQGFDYYCPLGTPIYGTSDGGVISGKGGPDGAPGWQVTVRYPNYITRNVHMNGPSPLAIGAPVNSNTVIGYVGATGNAVNIIWNNKRHLHHEVYPNGYDGPVDPLWYYGPIPSPGLAGGGTTPTPSQPEQERIKMKNIAPVGLPDKAIVGAGFGMVFADYGDYQNMCNVWGLNPEAPQTVGVATDTVAARRALLNRIIALHREGSAPPITTPPSAQTIANTVVQTMPAPAPVPTAAEIAQAVVAALPPSQGGTGTGPSAQEIALAVEQQLADNFGLIPQAVNLDLKNRL